LTSDSELQGGINYFHRLLRVATDTQEKLYNKLNSMERQPVANPTVEGTVIQDVTSV
jgi:hypothetical protein